MPSPSASTEDVSGRNPSRSERNEEDQGVASALMLLGGVSTTAAKAPLETADEPLLERHSSTIIPGVELQMKQTKKAMGTLPIVEKKGVRVGAPEVVSRYDAIDISRRARRNETH